MPRENLPELRNYLSKKLSIKLNGNRTITGRLSGYDAFMNLVIEEATEIISPTESQTIGLMVRIWKRK